MPRPKKKRFCEGTVCAQAFKPTGTPMDRLSHIKILRDEVEALKLCDKKGLTQEQAGQKMEVSRGTIQRMLCSARKKVATAISDGAALVFEEE